MQRQSRTKGPLKKQGNTLRQAQGERKTDGKSGRGTALLSLSKDEPVEASGGGFQRTAKGKVLRVKNPRVRNDAQLREFVERDLGDDIEASGSAIVVRPQRPTSILLGNDLISKLKEKGAKRGLPYQTMLKMIVMEHLDEY